MKVNIKVAVAIIGLFVMGLTVNAQTENPITEKGSVEYYGEKAGFLRPCRGNLVAVCKKATSFTSNDEGNAEKSSGFVIVSDGETKAKVNVEDFNFSDGSINENAVLYPVED